MKLQQLQILLAVVEHGGIRAAARQLHLSQAAVTKAMKSLEDTAGTALLLRGARGASLTAAGQNILVRARLIARQVALIQEDLRQAAGDDFGTVRVGVTPFVTLAGLGEAFRWFRLRYRNVAVQLVEGLMWRVLPQLRDGSLDIAVAAADVGEVRDDVLHCQRLRQFTQCIVVREGHPILKAPTAKALANLEWVLTQPLAYGGDSRVQAMFTTAGVAPPTHVVLCETLAAMTLLRHSDSAAIFPQPLLGHPESRGIVAIDACPLHPSDIELLLLTRPDVPLTKATQYFAHCLTQVSSAPESAIVSTSLRQSTILR